MKVILDTSLFAIASATLDSIVLAAISETFSVAMSVIFDQYYYLMLHLLLLNSVINQANNTIYILGQMLHLRA